MPKKESNSVNSYYANQVIAGGIDAKAVNQAGCFRNDNAANAALDAIRKGKNFAEKSEIFTKISYLEDYKNIAKDSKLIIDELNSKNSSANDELPVNQVFNLPNIIDTDYSSLNLIGENVLLNDTIG